MIKQARNYTIGGGGVDPEPPVNSITTIVRFANPVVSPVAEVADMKYNKASWFSLEWDDASMGAIVAKGILDSTYYTDGCGNNIPYSGTLAINGANELTGIPYPYDGAGGTMTIANMIAMINSGWEISDHGYFHDPTGFGADVTPLESTILMRDRIKFLLNYWTRSKVVPQNYAGHATAAFDVGYLYSTSQGTFDDFPPIWPLNPPGNYADVPEFGALRRDFSDDMAGDMVYLKSKIDQLVTGTNKFYRLGSHTINEAAFDEFIDYVVAQANDTLLVTNTRELLEYREMQSLPTYFEHDGDTLTIVTDITSLDEKNRYRDLSFNITSSEDIISVTTNGDDATFNAATGLVNVFMQKKQWLDTDVDLSQYFDHLYDSSHAINDEGDVVSDGEVVNTIVDEGKTGGKSMFYSGNSNPHLTGTPPKFRSQVGGYIQFNNQYDTAFVSSQYETNQPFPRELFFVANQTKFNTYEALWNAYNSHYIGDLGDDDVRVRGATDEAPVGYPRSIGVGFPIRQNYLFHIKYIPDVIGIRCEVRINKSLVSSDAYAYSDGRLTRPTFAWGADTNSGNFGALFQGWSLSELTTEQRTIIENELYDRYNIGERLRLPMAENLLAIQSGTTYTASYNYVNPLGYAEDVSQRIVRWVLLTSEGIQSGIYHTSANNLITWNSVDHPLPGGGYYVNNVEVICVDVLGNRFHVPEKVFVN